MVMASCKGGWEIVIIGQPSDKKKGALVVYHTFCARLDVVIFDKVAN